MKIPLIVLLLAVSWLDWAAPLFRASNTSALTRAGRDAYDANDAATAREKFAQATAIEQSARNLYNTGTATLAAGDIDAGTRLMEAAVEEDSALAADAAFNEGTALLKQKSLDAAVDRLKASLRLRPDSIDAKRNLEIALRRQQDQQQSGGAGQQQSQPQPGKGQQNQQSGGDEKKDPSEAAQQPGEQSQQPGEVDAEAVLRAAAQQEAQELKRLRGKRFEGEPRGTGW